MYKKFRTLREDKVRIALTSGHITVVDKDWVDLHEIFWSEAYSKGCMSEDMVGTTPPIPQIIPPTKAEPQTLSGKDRNDLIEMAMREVMGKGNPEDLTAQGKIRTNRLLEILGFEPTRDERDAIQEKVGAGNV